MRRSGRGFSSVEVAVVVLVVAILAAVALPPLFHWRQEIDSGRGARGAYDSLRLARSKSISTNYQHMVSFDPTGGRYRVVKGSQSYHTPDSGWNAVVQEWVMLANGVSMRSGPDGDSTATVNVQFNADGSARLEAPAGTVAPSANVSISFRGDQEGKRNSIVVSTCGRISMQ